MSGTATKPLGHRAYGSIGHLPGSRRGPGDHGVNEGQARIATAKVRDKRDRVIAQEKLDGSNVSVALLDGVLLSLGRAGWPAVSSPSLQHRYFAQWALTNEDRFRAVLREGDRLCGEWLAQAHGTRYTLTHEPFVAFDLMRGMTREPFDVFTARVAAGQFVTPRLLNDGPAFTLDAALDAIEDRSHHGAIDPIEGAVWRVERVGKSGPAVDFLCKYVRPEKVDGVYLPEISGADAVWNWTPAPTPGA